MANVCFTPPQFGSFGFVMASAGAMVGVGALCCCQKWFANLCQCCMPGMCSVVCMPGIVCMVNTVIFVT